MAAPLQKRLGAEFLGTLWLVFGGAGSGELAAAWTQPSGDHLHLGIGFAGVALAFGLTVLTGAFAFGHISGGHFNPAVTLGLVAGKRHDQAEAGPYIAAQVLGGIAGGLLLFIIAGKSLAGVSNGFGDHSPTGYGFFAAFLIEFILTFFFLLIIIGSTSAKAAAGFAPIAIGLALTLIHLVSIPVTNTSVNPARSIGTALFAGDFWFILQLPLFIIAPIAGAIAAGIVSNWLQAED